MEAIIWKYRLSDKIVESRTDSIKVAAMRCNEVSCGEER